MSWYTTGFDLWVYIDIETRYELMILSRKSLVQSPLESILELRQCFCYASGIFDQIRSMRLPLLVDRRNTPKSWVTSTFESVDHIRSMGKPGTFPCFVRRRTIRLARIKPLAGLVRWLFLTISHQPNAEARQAYEKHAKREQATQRRMGVKRPFRRQASKKGTTCLSKTSEGCTLW